MYAVTVVIGDAEFTSTHTLNVEDVAYWTGLTLAANQFAETTQVVTIADGRLTLDAGNAPEKATRIDYIEIIPKVNDVGVLPFASADLTLNGKLSYADVLAFGAGWGNHDEGATLEQLLRAGDLNFDGTTDAADWDILYQAWTDAGLPALNLSAVLNPIAGDYNRDALVDDDDIGLWRSSWGSMTELAADGNGDDVVNAADYVVWRKHAAAQMRSGAVTAPKAAEPASAVAVSEPLIPATAAPATVAPVTAVLAPVASVMALSAMPTPVDSVQVGATVDATAVSKPLSQARLAMPTSTLGPTAYSPPRAAGRIAQHPQPDRSSFLQQALIRKHVARSDRDLGTYVSALDEALKSFDAKDVSQVGEKLLSALSESYWPAAIATLRFPSSACHPQPLAMSHQLAGSCQIVGRVSGPVVVIDRIKN